MACVFVVREGNTVLHPGRLQSRELGQFLIDVTTCFKYVADCYLIDKFSNNGLTDKSPPKCIPNPNLSNCILNIPCITRVS